MSGPNQFMREAEYLDCGLLAARSKAIIDKIQGSNQLSDEDIRTLERASDFLVRIADGADLVSTGSSTSHNSRASMQALDLAMGPLESLKDLIRDGEVATFFRGMADAISQPKEGDERLNVSKQFFNVLYESVVETLNNDSPRLGEVASSTKVFGLH